MTFDSEWCRDEVAFAHKLGVPIYTIIDKDRYNKNLWKTTKKKHGVEGKSIIDMWFPKLGRDAWKTSAGHCFGAGSHQAIWYSSDQLSRDAALEKIEMHVAAAQRNMARQPRLDQEAARLSHRASERAAV